MEVISKRFPADTALNYSTFLNDKKIDGELYNFLQTYSFPRKKGDKYETVVYKKDLPKQDDICKAIKVKSRKTYTAHLKYLISEGYLEIREDEPNIYVLPNKEDIYIKIPLDTLKYLRDNCKEHVVKIYIYLGQRYKYAESLGRQYEFSSKEIGTHIGITVKDKKEGYEKVNNALDLLYNSGLIDFVSYYDGAVQKKKLTKFSLYHSKNEKVVGKNI